MSKAWVIDSSIGLSWIHRNQATPETDKLLEEVAEGTNVVVPTLWFMEMANGLLVLERRKRISGDDRKAAINSLSKLNFTVDEEASRAAFGKSFQVAEAYNLTIYDATYLELALRRNLPLASRDEALLAAAKRAGVKTL